MVELPSTSPDEGAAQGLCEHANRKVLTSTTENDLWEYDMCSFSQCKDETEALLEPEAKVKVI